MIWDPCLKQNATLVAKTISCVCFLSISCLLFTRNALGEQDWIASITSEITTATTRASQSTRWFWIRINCIFGSKTTIWFLKKCWHKNYTWKCFLKYAYIIKLGASSKMIITAIFKEDATSVAKAIATLWWMSWCWLLLTWYSHIKQSWMATKALKINSWTAT